MTKERFLQELTRRLRQLPPDEVERQRAYYEELLADMMEDGMEEEAAVEKLGDISEIVEEILRDTPLPTLVKTKFKPRNGWTTAAIVVAILGAPLWLSLLLALAATIFAVCLAIGAVILSLFVMVGALAIAGLTIIFRGVTLFSLGGSYVIFSIGSGLLLLGLVGLSFLAAKYAAIGLFRGGRWLFRAIKGLFIVKEGN